MGHHAPRSMPEGGVATRLSLERSEPTGIPRDPGGLWYCCGLLAGGAGEQTLDDSGDHFYREIRCGSGHGVLLIYLLTCQTCEACMIHILRGGIFAKKVGNVAAGADEDSR